MTTIAIADITEISPNVRSVATSPEADAGLRASIQGVGILEPVLVRPLDQGGYRLLHGRRRLAAATALGLTQIPAEIRDPATAVPDELVDGAANLVRAPVHPVDQWRLVQHLLGRGYTIRGAADSLGLTERETRRMALLAKLHPPIVEAMAGREMPPLDDLRDIANAEIARQAEAWKRYAPKHPDAEVDWCGLAGALQWARIDMSVAKFDDALAQKHGVHWEEDLFAPPGADGQPEWFTRNITGFRAAQQEWIETVQVPGLIAQGYQAVAAKLDKHGNPKAVPNADRHYGDAAKAPKSIIRSFHVGDDGQVRCELWKRDKAAAEKKAAKGKKATEPAAPPPAAPAAGESLGGPLDDAPAPIPVRPGATEEVTPSLSAAAAELPTGRHPLTAEGRKLVAERKTAAVREALQGNQVDLDHIYMLSAFVCALCGSNVRVTHGSGGNTQYVRFQDLAARLIAPDGTPRAAVAQTIYQVADEALSRMISASAPDVITGGSGRPFDWVARVLELTPPRYDTPEILAHASGVLLRELAPQAGVKPSLKVSELQRELAGKLPQWCPPGGGFDAAGPDEEEAEDAAEAARRAA